MSLGVMSRMGVANADSAPPPTDPTQDNSRYRRLSFRVEVNTVLHGFAGYFETTLYGDITLSKGGAKRGRGLRGSLANGRERRGSTWPTGGSTGLRGRSRGGVGGQGCWVGVSGGDKWAGFGGQWGEVGGAGVEWVELGVNGVKSGRGLRTSSGWSQRDLWGEVRGEGAGLSLNRGHCGGGMWPIRDGWKVKGWSLGVRGRQGGDSAGIRPETHSPGMFSWFPIFFPIKVGPAAAILGWRPSWAWQEISHFGLG